MNFRIGRRNFAGRFEQAQTLFFVPAIDERHAEPTHQVRVSRSEFESPPIESDAVSPVSNLHDRRRREQYEDHRAGHGNQTTDAPGTCSDDVSGEPRNRQEHADQREIGIAVGHPLCADLHDADHRHERPQIPGPADKEKRQFSNPEQRRGRDHQQNETAADAGRPAESTWDMGKRRPNRRETPLAARYDDVHDDGIETAQGNWETPSMFRPRGPARKRRSRKTQATRREMGPSPGQAAERRARPFYPLMRRIA